MALLLIFGFPDIQCCTDTDPILYKIIFYPVLQYSREFIFQRRTIYPRLSRRTTNGITNQTNRNPQTILQHSSKGVGYCRKVARRLRRSNLPLRVCIILQIIQRIQHCALPLHIASPTRLHIEQTYPVIGCLWNLRFCSNSLS